MSSQIPQNDPWYIRVVKVLGPYLLAAGGLTGGYNVAQKITQNPILQIVIAVVAGFLAYALSFINKVWQKLEGPLVDKTAEWIPSFLNNRFAGYRRRYLYYLSRAHHVLEFSGLTYRPAYNRELERIFVELDIAPVPPHLASAHILKSTPFATSASHTIWHYLSDKMLSSSTLVLLGSAGSGKSTLLKYIAFALSRSHLRSRLRRTHHVHYRFPVLLPIREYAAIIKNKPESTLPELVQAHVQKGNLVLPIQWLEQQFKRGKCLFMLDGLDEVPDEEVHKVVVEWIRKQLLSYPNNRFMITARPHGYIDTPLDDAVVLNVQPFTPAQIKSFIKQWYFIDELMRSEKKDTGAQLRASEGAGNLQTRLNQKPSLLEMAVNPLLLTMIVILASTGGSLPNNRLELYSEIFRVLLYRRRDAIGLTPKLSVQQKLEVLQPLASYMAQRRMLDLEYDQLCQVITPHLTRISTELTPAEFLKEIAQNSGLFLEVSTGTWGFAHKTLQDYLAATYLKEKHRESILLKHINDDWWYEVICFYCAQADATKILQACLVQANTSVHALQLVLECDSQRLGADPAITQQLKELLQSGIEDADYKKRSIVAEVLLQQRLEEMVYLRDDVYIDTSPVSCAEYQFFLDEQCSQERYYHPWHWSTDLFQPGQGREPILGVQPLDVNAFCDWLTARSNNQWHYRLPHMEEISQIISHLDKAAWSTHSMGFWAENNEFIWANGSAPEYPGLEEQLLDQLLLDHARALGYDRVRARDKREPIDEALELERELNEMQAPDINPSLVHNINIHPLVLDKPGFKSDVVREAVKIAEPAILDCLNFLSKRTSPPYIEEEKQLRWFVRYLCQLQARRSYFWLQQTHVSLKWQQRLSKQLKFEKSVTEQEFMFYRRICTDFTLLELSTRGKLPAWEAILLVKERNQV
jgi:energy-coupling factor transporter ATP-binding protein EcfA2